MKVNDKVKFENKYGFQIFYRKGIIIVKLPM